MLAEARAHGLDLPLVEKTLACYQEVVDQGFGDDEQWGIGGAHVEGRVVAGEASAFDLLAQPGDQASDCVRVGVRHSVPV